jgi:hypothetical protein
MSWSFVGRAEQIEQARRALALRSSGPVLIRGLPGIGRTCLLNRVLDHVDPRHERVLALRPAGAAPFAAVRASLPGGLPGHPTAAEASSALAEYADGRRLVVAADDAHLTDPASLLAVRDLSRAGRALLLVTAVSAAGPPRPDPTGCLAYERDLHPVLLPPLSVMEVSAAAAGVLGGAVRLATAEALRAATDGNPRRLHDLLVGDRLADRMVRRDGSWTLGPARPGECAAPGGPSAARGAQRAAPAGPRQACLVSAARDGWQQLAVERTDQLCRLAMWSGAGEAVAPVWSALLLLRGRPDEALGLLDALPAPAAPEPELALIRALTLAFGFGRVAEAADFLLRAAAGGAGQPALLLSCRAWILAVTGATAAAAAALAGLDRRDREAALFVHATRAVICAAAGPAQTVSHLRRALAVAEPCHHSWPWMGPYLRACLIDALLLDGRISEATSAASGFHASVPGSGWEVAVALGTLIATRPCPAGQSPRP